MTTKQAKVSPMKSKPITITQPLLWIEAWKTHMKRTGRSNFSEFIGEAVNTMIDAECKSGKIRSAVKGKRGVKGIRSTAVPAK